MNLCGGVLATNGSATFSCQLTMKAIRTEPSVDCNNSSSCKKLCRRGNPNQQKQAGATENRITVAVILTLIAVFGEITQHVDSVAIDRNETRIWRIVERDEWKARTPISNESFIGPSTYVIIHHSNNPGICLTSDACKASMRSMQDFHMDGHGWTDIGYSFAIGGDGNVYKARGYNVVGAHAPNYNSRSIGILLIGNFMEKLPPAPMLQVTQEFIEHSITAGFLSPDYVMYGHRQVRATECPGRILYSEIQKWPHWQEVDETLL